MLTLLLLRHAKSSWDNSAMADYDRPLAKRGVKAAPRMGAEMAARRLRPDLILCSAAARAKETLSLMLPELGRPSPEIVYDEAIYMSEPAALLTLLRKLASKADRPQTAMLVGHNPGLEELAELLIGGGEEDAQERIAEKFPTCALAVLRFDVEDWGGIAPGTGRLTDFITPGRLT